VTVVIAAALLLGACGSGADSADTTAAATSPEDQVAQATKEGELLWYTAISTDASNAVIGAFEARYPGIDVKLLRATTADLWQRFQTENAARNNVADVVNFADWGVIDSAKKAKLLAKYQPSSVSDAIDANVLDKQYVDGDGYYFASRVLDVAVVYNTDKVPADVAPKTWNDLADPWWGQHGKLGILDPARTATINAYWSMDKAGLAQPFFTGIAPHRPKIYDQGGAILNALSSGEIDGGIITDYDAWGLIAKGQSPLAVVYPDAGVGAWTDYVGLAAQAPHPNAGRLFTEFLGSKEGSEAIAKAATVYVVRKDVPPYPADKPPFTGLHVLPFDPAQVTADRDAFLEKFNQWIGR